MHDQVDGFTVETRSIPNYVTMIELDGVGTDCIRTISSAVDPALLRRRAIKGDDGLATLVLCRWQQGGAAAVLRR